VGYVVGRVQTGILRAAWWVPMVTAAIASAAGVVLFAVLEALLGDTHVFDRRLLSVVAVVSILNALLVPPMIRVFRWVFAEDALHQTRVWQ
jgi:cell shape-determining protein MreD